MEQKELKKLLGSLDNITRALINVTKRQEKLIDTLENINKTIKEMKETKE